MNSGRFRRRTIALVAAYAMALQMLFAALIPASPASWAGSLAALCSHDADGTGQQPADHDLPCAALCAAIGHGVAGPVPPDVVIVATAYAVAAIGPANDWVTPPIALPAVHAARGPPLA